jgi:hypothetical protein
MPIYTRSGSNEEEANFELGQLLSPIFRMIVRSYP